MVYDTQRKQTAGNGRKPPDYPPCLELVDWASEVRMAHEQFSILAFEDCSTTSDQMWGSVHFQEYPKMYAHKVEWTGGKSLIYYFFVIFMNLHE